MPGLEVTRLPLLDRAFDRGLFTLDRPHLLAAAFTPGSHRIMGDTTHPASLAIVKLESYDGEDTFVHCGNGDQEWLYVVISIEADGTAEIIDYGYRTYQEALTAWPEAGIRRQGAQH